MTGEKDNNGSSQSRYQSFSPITAAHSFVKDNHIVSLIEAKQMWYYDFHDAIWKADGESYFMAWMSSNYPGISRNDFNETRFHVQSMTVVMKDKFVPHPKYIQFRNKQFFLEGLQEVVGQSDGWDDAIVRLASHYLRIRLDTELDENAGMPEIFLDALQKAIPDGRDRFHCLQAFSSLLLIRSMRIEKAFFFLGSGGNGKSTIMKAIENIFNPYISHVDLTDLVKDRFASASLIDKLANVYADIQSLKFKDMAIFKAISTGDTISVGDKYEKRHDETIKVIQIYSANKMPYIDDKNPGFLRRVSPIVFDMVIKDKDPYIDEKLSTPEERKKILALLIKIARYTKKYGFLYEKPESEILRILEEKEDPITQFLNDNEYVTQDISHEIERGELYQIYLGYCKSIGCAPKQKTAFSRYISERGYDTRRSNMKRYWIGLGSAIKPKATLDE